MVARYKLVFNVPVTHADAVRKAVGDAGAGRVARYGHCSFSARGIGRFTPLEGANPHIGQIGTPEQVDEEQVQVDVNHEDIKAVLAALKAAHPYEEIGYEIYNLVDEDLL